MGGIMRIGGAGSVNTKDGGWMPGQHLVDVEERIKLSLRTDFGAANTLAYG